LFFTDVHSLGLSAAQGLRFITGFYWDRDNDTRAWSKRFFDHHGRMPTSAQASVYSAVRHYLRAIEAAGTDAAMPVMAKMRAPRR
jgi:branched-chain amino acid transport system substrate-binding protein